MQRSTLSTHTKFLKISWQPLEGDHEIFTTAQCMRKSSHKSELNAAQCTFFSPVRKCRTRHAHFLHVLRSCLTRVSHILSAVYVFSFSSAYRRSWGLALGWKVSLHRSQSRGQTRGYVSTRHVYPLLLSTGRSATSMCCSPSEATSKVVPATVFCVMGTIATDEVESDIFLLGLVCGLWCNDSRSYARS